MITIRINNTEITGLKLNGNNYVASGKIDTSDWPPVFAFDANGTVPDQETGADIPYSEHYDHAKLIQHVTYPWDEGKWYLCFAPVSAQEFAVLQQQGQIEYIAMMTDVEL